MAPAKRRPPPQPLRVEYAVTGRAKCKVCKERIKQGSVRLIRRVWARFHDGYDEQLLHFHCGARKHVADLDQVVGWQALRWEVVLRMAKKFRHTLDETHPVVQDQKERNLLLWQLKPRVALLPKKLLLTILTANQQFFNGTKIAAEEAAHIIADGLLFGKLPVCPLCKDRALLQEGAVIRCSGFVSGSSRCPLYFHLANLLHPAKPPTESSFENADSSTFCRTEPFYLSEEAKNNSFFKNWIMPKEAPAWKKFGDIRLLCAPCSSAGGSSEESGAEENSSASAVGQEFCGLSFSSVGATDPPRSSLEELVVAHGGTFSASVGQWTNFLLTPFRSEAAAKAAKQSAQAVKLGVPVVEDSFLQALLSKPSRKNVGTLEDVRRLRREGQPVANLLPQGLILRRRRYAAFYCLLGEPTRKVPTIQGSLAALRSRARRPTIKKNSPLLQVDPLFTHGGREAAVYVDRNRNAFNFLTQFANVETGDSRPQKPKITRNAAIDYCCCSCYCQRSCCCSCYSYCSSSSWLC
eukprot:GHVT01072705.1.p1 GENE.GHVT01072705.1~~GHVT01072705.1.p1  ORF type:complete len:522 (-),score=115.40 GHVT01072705.1:503-2068(-)